MKFVGKKTWLHSASIRPDWTDVTWAVFRAIAPREAEQRHRTAISAAAATPDRPSASFITLPRQNLGDFRAHEKFSSGHAS